MELLPFFTGLVTLALIYALLGLGLNVQFGYTGLLNFGHVAFFAAGAFASAIVTLPPPGTAAYLEAGARYQVGLGQPVLIGFLAGGAAAGLLALLIGLTSIRLSSHYLAVATFALAEIFRSVLINEAWLTRGQFGISNVPQPGRGTLVDVATYPYLYLVATVIAVAILLAITVRITESPFGRTLRAIRDDELAARALGKATPWIKLRAFVIGGVLAGFAGSLWSHSIGVVHVGQFVPIVTFQVWLAVLMGGVGNHFGVMVGAFMLIAIREGTRFLGGLPGLDAVTAANPSFLPSLRFVMIGLLLILVVRYFPSGVLPERTRRAAPFARSRPEPPEDGAGDGDGDGGDRP